MSTSSQTHQDQVQGNGSDLVQVIGRSCKAASKALRLADSKTINDTLQTLAEKICQSEDLLLEANKLDMDEGKKAGLSDALLDRLNLTPDRIQAMGAGIQTIIELPDPIGKILWNNKRPNGLHIQRVSVPIGVLGIIYESRPNVTIDAAALCLKSKNGVILRGGSDSLNTSLALHRLIQEAMKENDLNPEAISMIPNTDREAVGAMLTATQFIDVIVPRGGKSLIERVLKESRVPVFGHLEGLCHTYIHESVDPDIALSVPLNAKMRRTGICGAMETLILDMKLDPTIGRTVLEGLINAGCEIVGDKLAQALDNRVKPAISEDWTTEYLSPKLSVCVVDGVDEAITHINTYGSNHTEAILAEDQKAVQKFLNEVDSGIVMHNTSTQFADGGEFGMGAEIGIATGKLHARGPVGLEQLTTYKYIVKGQGQTRP